MMIRFFRALLAHPFRFKFSLESGDVFLDIGIVWIMVSAFLAIGFYKQKTNMSKEIELTSVEKWVMKYMNYSLKDIKLNRKLLKEDIQPLLSKPKQR